MAEWNGGSSSQGEMTYRERFVGPGEAGAFLGVHPKTVQRMARRGGLPAHPFGDGSRKRWRFLLSELDQCLRAR